MTSWNVAPQASLSITKSQTHVHLVSDAMLPSHPLHPLLLLSIFPSIRIFSNESILYITWPEDWSFSFSISPSNECSGLISFKIDWLDLIAVQGPLKSLLQHQFKSINSLVLSYLKFQPSHTYMTTGKNMALIRQIFVGKVMSPL